MRAAQAEGNRRVRWPLRGIAALSDSLRSREITARVMPDCTMPDTSHFDAIGEVRLRAIIDDFVGRIVSDLMIGFFFTRVDQARLREMEYQHAAAHLGGPVVYQGRPLGPAHGPHRIMGGHFARRNELLRQVLVAHDVPAPVRIAWLAHVESLRAEITPDVGSECAGSASEKPKA